MSSGDKLYVYGYKSCGYFQRAKRIAKTIAKEYENVEAVIKESSERGAYHSVRAKLAQEIADASNHRTSPLVYMEAADKTITFIGGASDLIDLARTVYPSAI
jgi:glutaredoxin